MLACRTRTTLVGLALALVACHAARVAAAEVAAPTDSVAVAAPTAEPLAAFPTPAVRAWQVGLLRPDRLQHAGFSFALAAALTVAFRGSAGAAAVTLAVGAGKELWDARGTGADPVDLAADAAGVGLSLITIRGRAP